MSAARPTWRLTAGLLCAIAVAAAAPAQAARNDIRVLPVSSDPTSDPSAQHDTELEVDSMAVGSSVVGTYQAGRFDVGGASAGAGFAASADRGRSWVSGLLPGLTPATSPPGPHPRVVDENVAYDARSKTWLITSVPVDLVAGKYQEVSVMVSRSTDGGRSWSLPGTVVAPLAGTHPDKQWTVCDNHRTSAHYGTCYTAFAETENLLQTPIRVVSSSDGGATWSPPVTTGIANGFNAQPVILPSGRLVIVATIDAESAVVATGSSDGGRTFTAPVMVAAIQKRRPVGLRTFVKPSVDVDGAGRVWTTWQDCRFRPNCSSNDIVVTRSSDGAAWTPVQRVPVDDLTSGVDHLMPALATDPGTNGNRVAITFDVIPHAVCDAPGAPGCLLGSAYVSSEDGGETWTAATPIGPPVPYANYPQTPQGRMPGDYESVAFSGATAIVLFPVASTPSAGRFHVDMRAALAPPLTASCTRGGTRDRRRRVSCRLSSPVTTRSRVALVLHGRRVATGTAKGRHATLTASAKRVHAGAGNLSGRSPAGEGITYAARVR